MKLKQKKHQQIPGIIQEKVATPETPRTDGKFKTETEEPAPTDRADQILETDQGQETDPHQETETITDRHETETQEAEAENRTEATEATETDQPAEPDHLIATDIQLQAAAADTDQAAETDIHGTKHLPITDRRETRTPTDQSQDQAIIPETPEIDPYQETDTPTDHEDHTLETETAIEDNVAERQIAKVQEGHNHPTRIKRLYQG
jgi:hypothetical protein